MAAAAHRRAIEGERQYLTLRQTLRTVPMTFSMMLVQASERRSSRGRPSLVTVSISQDRSGNAVPVRFETAGEIANERFGPFGVVHFPGLPQDAPHRSVHRFGQPLQNVARLVNLATLDRRIASPRSTRLSMNA